MRIPSTSRSIALPFRLHPWEDKKRARLLALVSVSVCAVSPNLRLMSRSGGRKSNTREPWLPECTTNDDSSRYLTAFVALCQ